MVHLFEDCNLCAIHAKRVTISESAGAPLCHVTCAAWAAALTACVSDTYARARSAQGPAARAAHPGARVRRLVLLTHHALLPLALRPNGLAAPRPTFDLS